MEGFEGPEVPPCGGEAVLQTLHAALARGLEQLYVTSQPGHEGPDHDDRHLGQRVVERAVVARSVTFWNSWSWLWTIHPACRLLRGRFRGPLLLPFGQ